MLRCLGRLVDVLPRFGTVEGSDTQTSHFRRLDHPGVDGNSACSKLLDAFVTRHTTTMTAVIELDAPVTPDIRLFGSLPGDYTRSPASTIRPQRPVPSTNRAGASGECFRERRDLYPHCTTMA